MILNVSMLIPCRSGLACARRCYGAREPGVAQPTPSRASPLLRIIYALFSLPYDTALPGIRRQPSCGVQHRHHHHDQQGGEHETGKDGDRHGTTKKTFCRSGRRPTTVAGDPEGGCFRTKRLFVLTGQRTETAIPLNDGARDLLCAFPLAVR